MPLWDRLSIPRTGSLPTRLNPGIVVCFYYFWSFGVPRQGKNNVYFECNIVMLLVDFASIMASMHPSTGPRARRQTHWKAQCTISFKNSVSTKPTRVWSDGSFHPANCDLGRVLIDPHLALALGWKERERSRKERKLERALYCWKESIVFPNLALLPSHGQTTAYLAAMNSRQQWRPHSRCRIARQPGSGNRWIFSLGTTIDQMVC